MTLGGLALAIGILVDEATVEIENIHAQMAQTDSIALAVRLGNAADGRAAAAGDALHSGRVRSFVLHAGCGPALFVPLSLAVGFAMIASYILSSTFVPVVSVWLLRHFHVDRRTRTSRCSAACGGAIEGAVELGRDLRWSVAGGVPCRTGAC